MHTTSPTYHKGFFFFTTGMGMASTALFAYHIASGTIPSDMTGVLTVGGIVSGLLTLACVVWRHALFTPIAPSTEDSMDDAPSMASKAAWDAVDHTTSSRTTLAGTAPQRRTMTVGHAITSLAVLGALIFAGYHIFHTVKMSAYGESTLAIPLDADPIMRTVDQISAPYFPFQERFQDGIFCATTGPVIVAVARDRTDRVFPVPDKAYAHAQRLCSAG